MISEIIQLGIRGDKLVTQQLKRIQDAKKKLALPEIVKLGLSLKLQKAPTGKEISEMTEQKTLGEGAPPEQGKPSEEDRPPEARRAGGIKESVFSAARGAMTMDTAGFLAGLGKSASLVTAGASELVATFGQATLALKDRIRESFRTVSETESIRKTAAYYTGEENFLRPDKANEFKSRRDISRSEQREIIEALSSSYGRFSEDFRQQMQQFFGTSGKPYDVRQSTALAQGNFEALGTDQGFFMQKIASSIQNLPPSIKQKLMPQLLEMVPEQDRIQQTDYRLREQQAAMEDMERQKADVLLFGTDEKNRGEEFAMRARQMTQIQDLQNTIDTALAGAVGSLVENLRIAASAMGEFVTEPSVSTAKRVIFPTR